MIVSDSEWYLKLSSIVIYYYDHSNGALHEYLAHGLDRLLIDLYASTSRIIRILSCSIITLVSRARLAFSPEPSCVKGG